MCNVNLPPKLDRIWNHKEGTPPDVSIRVNPGRFDRRGKPTLNVEGPIPRSRVLQPNKEEKEQLSIRVRPSVPPDCGHNVAHHLRFSASSLPH